MHRGGTCTASKSAESNNSSNLEPRNGPPFSSTHQSIQHREDNLSRPDATRRTQIYTDNPGHASRLTDEERQRLEALAADSSGGAIFVTYDLVHRIDTPVADEMRRANEALMQYLFQDDIWEAIDTGNINDTGTQEEHVNGNGNGRQGGRGLKLSNGTGEAHEEESKQERNG
ncbi:uncharacterized protein N7500_007797 [Penicillium coprophilum]|uniref:uncharacterized protein n=1 Tax=Penicillium coprophilum TaxID=36646 RepID=UPI00239AE3A9|nr:uncharacterized protein N7500_007797 [Penicillium coprophilum]KAJ5158146.1 hypothetical protein N7500_007797 [Penicillium coprophilum]